MRGTPEKRPVLLLSIIALLIGTATARAVAPTLRALDRAGLQSGATTVLTIDGDNLLPDPKLVLSVPISKQVVRPGATASRVIIDVTLDKSAVPGLYNLRLANANGLSTARIIAIDALPQRTWEPKVTALPVALHGSLGGSGKMTTSFTGKAGESILCEIEAQRLGGKLRPVLHLSDERGRELAWAWPSSSLAGDCRISATLPADGRYSVEVHDSQYAAVPGNFRLKLGTWQYADAVFPAAVRRGTPAEVELLGSAGGQRVKVQASGETASLPIPWINTAIASGPRPWVVVSDLTEFVEKDAVAVQDAPAAPVALNGRLAKPDEVDSFRLKVKPGEKLRFEVFADKLGSPMDAVLKLQRDNGTLLAQADDAPDSPDPTLDFTVPADLQSLVVSIEDVHSRGQPDFVYRIVVKPVVGNADPADFRIIVADSELNVSAGGTRVIEVDIERRGYNGPIRLALDGLPPGVQVQGTDVPAGADGALLILTGTGTTTANSLVTLRGTSLDPKVPIVQLARVREHPLQKRQPWLSQELGLALTPKEKLTFTAAWGDLPASTQLVPGASLKVPLTFTPPKEENGGVRFYVLSSHRPPLVNGRPDPNQGVRKDQGQFLDVLPGKNSGEFVVVLPGTMPTVSQDLVFRADLLSKDRLRVIAQVFTPVRRFSVLNPIVVKLPAAQVEVPLNPTTGAEVKLAGKIERRGGFKGDVTVSIAGLPPGVPPPAINVAAAMADFQLVFRLPPTFKPLELNELEVFATGRYTPTSQVLNRSDDAAVRVKLVPSAAPKK